MTISVKRARRGLTKGVGMAVLVAAVVLGFLVGLSDWLLTGERTLFPVRYVRIEGDVENLDEVRFTRALAPSVSGGYFSLNIGEIEDVARTFAWVDQAQVERLWPDTVVIRISEHKPVAAWAGGALINGRGDRFSPSGAEQFTALPVIDAPVGTERQMLQVMTALNERLQSRRLKVAKIELSKRHAWIVRLDSGLELYVGRQDPLLATDRYLELVPKLGEDRANRVLRLDLRYPSGFSIVWKPVDGSAVDMPSAAGV